MTSPTLRRLGKLWQKRLNLRNWAITFELCAEIKDGAGKVMDVDGLADWNSDIPSATISIREHQSSVCHEETLIHEMLHLLFEGHTSGASVHDVNVERAINSAAAALYIAYRGAK